MTSLDSTLNNHKPGLDSHATTDNDAREFRVWPVALLFYGPRPHPFYYCAGGA